MYNNSYSQSKFGASAKKIHKARGKSCGYYMKIVFFFSSLIQTLIIVSLVLFLVYGQPEESAAEKRLQVLDPMHNELITKHGYLQEEFRNLTLKMNVTNREMEYMQRNFTILRQLNNNSYYLIINLRGKLSQSQMSLPQPPCNCQRTPQPPPCQSNGQLNGLQYENSQLKKWLEIVQGNFSGTFHVLKDELDSANRDRESLRLETITLRQEKATTEREIDHFKRTCKEDFIKSMEGIPEVTKAFRQKIDTLFPQLIPFHITCPKQREQLEQIQYNCSSLSAEVENKFQPYLNDVGFRVSNIVHRVSHLEAKKASLDRNLFECKKNLSSLEENCYNNLRDTRERQDKVLEKALLEHRKLRGEKELLDGTLRLKESEINMLKEKINASLANCGHRPPGGVGIGTGTGGSTFSVQSGSGIKPTARGSGGAGSSTPGSGHSGTGTGRTGSGITGLGSPTGGGTHTASFGTGSDRPGSSGTGYGSSSRTGSTGTGSNMGSFGIGAGAGHSGTGFGSTSNMGAGGTGFGSTNMGAGGTGFGSTSNMGAGGTGFGSTSNIGAGGTGFGNTGSAGAGGSRSAFPGAGTGTTGLGNTGFGGAGGSRSAFPGAGTGTTGLGNTGFGGAGGSRSAFPGAGTGTTGLGNTGFGGAGGSRSAFPGAGTGTTGLGNTGFGGAGGSRSAFPGAGTGTTGLGNTGFGGAGSSRTSQSGTGPGGTGFGSAGTGRTGFNPNAYGRTGTGGNIGLYGGGSYGTTDPITNHLRELQKSLNPEQY